MEFELNFKQGLAASSEGEHGFIVQSSVGSIFLYWSVTNELEKAVNQTSELCLTRKSTALCLYFTQLQFLKLISYALRVMGKAYSIVRSSGSILNSDQRSDLKKLCFFDINWLNLEHRPTAFKREKPRFLCEWLAKFSTLIDYVLARVSTIFCSRYWRNSLYWYIISTKNNSCENNG